MKRFVFLFTLSLLSVISFTQRKLPAQPDKGKDTLKLGNIVYAWNVDEFNMADSVLIDTLWFNKHNFNPWIGNNYLSSFGTPMKNNILIDRKDADFFFNQPYIHILNNHQKTKFYRTKKPFTYLVYNTGGSKDSQLDLEILHTQNINKYLNFGLKADIVSSKRFFEDDKSLRSHYLSFFSSYTKEEWNLYFSYNTNKITHDEFGGLESKGLFEDSSDYTITGRLSNAQNLLKTKDVHLSTEFFIIGNDYDTSTVNLNSDDSIKNTQLDTSDLIDEKRKRLSLLYDVGYVTNEKIYSDDNPTAAFYSDYNILRDSSNTADEAYRKELNNRFRILYKDTGMYFGAGLKHEYVQYSFLTNYSLDNASVGSPWGSLRYESFNNLLFDFRARLKFTPELQIGGYGNYHISGFTEGDYKARLRLKWQKDGKSIFGDVQFKNSEPDFFYQNYNSNYFEWHRGLSKSKHLFTSIGYKNKELKLSLLIKPELYHNYTYLNSEINPVQHQQALKLFSAQMKKDFHLGKFILNNRVNYQYSDNQNVLSIPDYYLYHEFKFRHMFYFKSTGGKLYSQIGFSVYYYPEYYADSYMPSLNLFYNQNQEKIGGKAILNAFLNLKIKRTAFYLKYYHLNGLWEPREYYTSPLYPMSPGILKFGITWSFYN
jgi:hypothetical protein